MVRVNCEAVMWKITTRGFTLEEVLIMAAMNLLTSADTAAKRENRASQKSKETKHAAEVLDKTSSAGCEHSGTRIHHCSRAGEPIRSDRPEQRADYRYREVDFPFVTGMNAADVVERNNELGGDVV